MGILELLRYGRIFFRFARWRFPLLVGLTFGASLLELIGIMALLPLLQVSLGEALDNPISATVAETLSAIGFRPTFASLTGMLIVIFMCKGVLTFAQKYWMTRTATLVRQELQANLVRGLERASYPFYTEHKTGHLTNLLITETARFGASLRSFGQVLVALIYTLVYLPAIIRLQLDMAVVLIAATLLAVLVARPMIAHTKKLSIGVSEQTAAVSSEMVQFVQSFPYLKATASQPRVRRHVVDRINQVANLQLRMGARTAILAGFKEPLAVAVLLGYLFYKVEVQGATLAGVVVVAILLYRLLGQLLELPVSLQRLHQLIGGVHMVTDFVDRFVAEEEADGTTQIESIDEDIRFVDVEFSHGDTQVLHGIDITIPRRKTIGIVGESGAGKTTLYHLLTGLIAPENGSIMIGEHAFEAISRQSLRQRIGYVPQEPVIFNDTVANNLTLWSGDADDPDVERRIIEAAAAANCDTFISRMPNGYDTVVGERGLRLSGGQRQRLAIARELYKNPDLLIFDEATSALDSEAEGTIQISIDQLRGARTVLVIAHRLSTVRNCDHIYVLSEGRVIEQGTFQGLYEDQGSTFRRMCDRQGVGVAGTGVTEIPSA